MTPEERAAFEQIRPFYGHDYNRGAGPEVDTFGGYYGHGHWEGTERWTDSARGIREAFRAHASGRFDTVRALEIGCGRGTMTAALNALGLRTVGVDIGADIPYAEGRACVGNACELPFAGGLFDLVVILDVIEHVPADLQATLLAELGRVTGSGLLIATVPAHPPFYAYDSSVGPRNHYLCGSASDWTGHFNAHGIEVVAQGKALERYGRPFDHLLDNYPLAMRWPASIKEAE